MIIETFKIEWPHTIAPGTSKPIAIINRGPDSTVTISIRRRNMPVGQNPEMVWCLDESEAIVHIFDSPEGVLIEAHKRIVELMRGMLNAQQWGTR